MPDSYISPTSLGVWAGATSVAAEYEYMAMV